MPEPKFEPGTRCSTHGRVDCPVETCDRLENRFPNESCWDGGVYHPDRNNQPLGYAEHMLTGCQHPKCKP